MTRQNLRIVLVAVVLIGVAGIAAGQTEELVRVISMEPGGRFSLGNISGEITVTGVDGDHLTIRATKRVAGRGGATADALDRVEIDIEERGNRVIVETDYPRRQRSLLQSFASLFSAGVREPFVAVDYLVTVPRDTGVAIESFDGDVTVEGVDGETHVKTVSGDGRLASLARLVGVETFSGDLEIADVRGDVLTAETVSGRIDIERVRAPRLQVKSFSGAVALQGVESRRVEVTCVPTFPSSSAGATRPAERPSLRAGGARFEGSPLLAGPASSCPPSAATWRSVYALPPCCNRLHRDPPDPLTIDRSHG